MPRERLRDAGAAVEEIAFDVSDGRDPYQAWRGAWMVGQQYARLSELERFGENLRGNVEAGLKVTAVDIAAAEQKRLEVFHRFRELFERFDVLLTPAAPVKPFPVEMNFPTEINGRKFENYIDWIAPAFLVTLVSLPAGSVPAGKTADGLPVGMQIVAPRFEEPLILRVAKLVQQSSGVGWPPAAVATMMRTSESASYCRHSGHRSGLPEIGSRCHRGPSVAREPGIHNHRLRLWIPGSPPSAAPRNDEQLDRTIGGSL